MLRSLYYILFRNQRILSGKKAIRGVVNLEYWKEAINLGDTLAWVVYDWMLKRENISASAKVKRTKHILTIGSVLGMGPFPFSAVVWGSGIHRFDSIRGLSKYRCIRKLDIRAVRGPVTRAILEGVGYACPEVYGDPAILMPLIYSPPCAYNAENKISVIRHFSMADEVLPDGVEALDIRTDNYKAFIDEICSSGKVISSSLHGIILAESYGVPAIFLQENMDSEILKFYDWYYSTNRKNIRIAYSVEEAIGMQPMPLPELSAMREKLLETFPYDMWRSAKRK